jgi:hypothetical protein
MPRMKVFFLLRRRAADGVQMATKRVVSRSIPTRCLPDILAGTPSPFFAADLSVLAVAANDPAMTRRAHLAVRKWRAARDAFRP